MHSHPARFIQRCRQSVRQRGCGLRGFLLIQLLQQQHRRFLDQQMFACFGGFDRPLAVHAVGQRNVDRLDLGIGQQLLVSGVGARDAQLAGKHARLLRIEACHSQ
jgi:hypothetical protein